MIINHKTLNLKRIGFEWIKGRAAEIKLKDEFNERAACILMRKHQRGLVKAALKSLRKAASTSKNALN